MLLSDTLTNVSNDLHIFDNEQCFFYYDESNNIRKLQLNEDDFNAPVNNDFILGGVMHFGENPVANINDLKSQLRIQKSVNELKFKHLSTHKDFLDCLSDSNVEIFLKWLLESELYIHFSNVNNLYYAVVDIIDTIDSDIILNTCAEYDYLDFILQMKNTLYKIAKDNYKAFYKLLKDFNYPNIDAINIKHFYDSILNLLINTHSEFSNQELLLIKLLQPAREQKELILLKGNPDKIILHSYVDFYMRPIGVFPYAIHTFDHECQIEKEFEKYDMYHTDLRLQNFSFADSKSNLFIQISDCIVGLIGKYCTFLNSIDVSDASQMLSTITLKQKQTLKLFVSLIKKSEDISCLLIHSFESRDEHDVGSYILNNFL